MKRLKILQTQSDFETQYPDGINSNDVVLVKENDKLYMATNNADGTYTEYGATGGGEITPEIIDELGLVTVDDISAFVKNGTVGNLYIGSDASTTGSSLVVVRQFQGQVSETKLSNVDNRSALVNRVGGIDNARVILSHEGLMVGYSGDKDTSFPAQLKHVALIEDTSANFALKTELDGLVDSNDISAFLKLNDVSNHALKSELTGLVDSNDISAFLKLNDVSNHALKSELEYIVWQGSEAQYEELANHTDYKIYLITE